MTSSSGPGNSRGESFRVTETQSCQPTQSPQHQLPGPAYPTGPSVCHPVGHCTSVYTEGWGPSPLAGRAGGCQGCPLLTGSGKTRSPGPRKVMRYQATGLRSSTPLGGSYQTPASPLTILPLLDPSPTHFRLQKSHLLSELSLPKRN